MCLHPSDLSWLVFVGCILNGATAITILTTNCHVGFNKIKEFKVLFLSMVDSPSTFYQYFLLCRSVWNRRLSWRVLKLEFSLECSTVERTVLASGLLLCWYVHVQNDNLNFTNIWNRVEN